MEWNDAGPTRFPTPVPDDEAGLQRVLVRSSPQEIGWLPEPRFSSVLALFRSHRYMRQSENHPSPSVSVHRTMTPLEWGLLVALSVCGAAFFFTGVAIRELPPLTIVFLRVALAAAILLVV